MNMKGNWVAILLLLAVVGYLYQENQDTKQLLQQMQQRQPNQMQPQETAKDDPYLKSQVKNTIAKNAKAIQKCYLDLLKTKPKVTAGQLKLDWQIDAEGKVFGAGVIFNQLGNEAFGNCTLDHIKKIRFPVPPVAPKYIEHSLYFKDEAQLEKERKDRAEGPLKMMKK